jgi:hypothetical protein
MKVLENAAAIFIPAMSVDKDRQGMGRSLKQSRRTI